MTEKKQELLVPSEYQFSSELISFPITIDGNPYTVKEATSDAVAEWRNSQMRGMKLSDGKVSGLSEVGQSEIVLVAHCVYDDRNDGNHVPIHVVKGWPDRITSVLFDRIKEISNLDKKVNSEATKN